MEPNRNPQATLNDLIDRILDKGLLLNTDLIISVAGIPLLGLNLRLALAGMETMLEYGIMKDWDEAQRAVACKEADIKGPPMGDGEYIIFSCFGTHWYNGGIYNTWRPGTIYITNKRLIMFRKMPPELLFEKYFEEIRSIAIKERDHFTGEKRQELYLLLSGDKIARLHSKDTSVLKNALEGIICRKGIVLEDNTGFADKKDAEGDFLQPGEDITHSGKMWYQMPFIAEGKLRYQWKPGHLYLTGSRLCWWYDFEGKLLFEIPSSGIMHSDIQDVQFGNTSAKQKSLVVVYRDGRENKIACFSADENLLGQWNKAVAECRAAQEDRKNTDSCPKCGKEAQKEELIKNGCPRCGWVSYRARY